MPQIVPGCEPEQPPKEAEPLAASVAAKATEATSAPTGYSIIKADSLDAAVTASKGCPVLAGGASVVVSEIFPAM